MSNPTKTPLKNLLPGQLPSSYMAKRQEKVREALEGTIAYYEAMGFELTAGVVLNPDTVNSGPARLNYASRQDSLARAQTGSVAFTNRSGVAYRITQAMWRTLPRDGSYFSQSVVGEAMRDTFYVSGGTRNVRGRLHKYYRPNIDKRTRAVVTAAEAARAKSVSGHELFGPVEAGTLFPGEEADKFPVRVNPHSDNGFPVQGHFGDPGAEEMVLSLVVEIRKELESLPTRGLGPIETSKKVTETIHEWIVTKPDLVAVKGKCKQDYYSEEKIHGASLRFYNALPKQMALLMQTATQPYEAQCKGLADDHSLHSAQKFTLVRGGADELVGILDEQMLKTGKGYVHVGDDSWLFVKLKSGKLLITDLDCSAFDLTQHNSVTLAVHRAFRNELAQIDPIAAGIWFAFMRKRLLVIESTVPVIMEHGGPSGAPLQSKVNDVLMEVLIDRTLSTLGDVETKEQFELHIKEVGYRMGFVVKVGQYHVIPGGTTLRRALRKISFQFIGYMFHTMSSGFVYPYLDLPRAMSRMVYPAGKWKANRTVFDQTEAVRLTSIAMGAGVAPDGMAVQKAMNQEVSIELMRVINDTANADFPDDRIKWSTQHAVHAADEKSDEAYASSLNGLQRAFDEGRGVFRLWRHPNDSSLDPTIPARDTRDVNKVVYSPQEILNLRPLHRLEREMDGASSTLVALDVPIETAFATTSAGSMLRPIRPVRLVPDVRDAVQDTVLARYKPKRKTYGRFPRQNPKTEEQVFKEKGFKHKLDAQDRRDAERLSAAHVDDEGGQDLGAKKLSRAKRRNAQNKGGSSSAARSRDDDDLTAKKDLRGARGSRRRRK